VKLIRKILFYLNIILVATTLLAFLSPYINPDSFWGLSFLGLVIPLLLLFNVMFILFWIVNNWKRVWLSVLCLFIGSNYIPLTVSFSAPKDVAEYDFSIGSYNLHNGYGNFNRGIFKYEEAESAKFAAFIKKDLNVDILCAQESNNHTKSLITGHYDYTHVPDHKGTAIFSKFPIVNNGHIDFGTKTNSCVWADILIQTDTVRVYSLHLQSNDISIEADIVAEEVEKNRKLNPVKVRSILSKYKKFVGIRALQAQKVRKHMDQSPYPVLLAGDFNDPPVSYSHRVLSRGFQDAFAMAGSGLGHTYAGRIPMLRIDNIIVQDFFRIDAYRTVYKKFSDHYPVICKISLPE
jgi:endonuclease/exonuclease/phosphatase family metal-dependent hydrolase